MSYVHRSFIIYATGEPFMIQIWHTREENSPVEIQRVAVYGISLDHKITAPLSDLSGDSLDDDSRAIALSVLVRDGILEEDDT